jgi:hypothetical protein
MLLCVCRKGTIDITIVAQVAFWCVSAENRNIFSLLRAAPSNISCALPHASFLPKITFPFLSYLHLVITKSFDRVGCIFVRSTSAAVPQLPLPSSPLFVSLSGCRIHFCLSSVPDFRTRHCAFFLKRVECIQTLISSPMVTVLPSLAFFPVPFDSIVSISTRTNILSLTLVFLDAL